MSKNSGKKMAVLGLAALTGACGSTNQQATTSNDGDTQQPKVQHPADSVTLVKRLQKLKEVRYDTTELPIAMCYSMAAPIVENYVCPVCGKETPSTSYQLGNMRSIRQVVENMKNLGYDVQLDEREFCQYCNGKKSDYPSLLFKISLNRNGYYHKAYSNLYDDYANLMTFLVCEKKKDFVNSVSNNQSEAEKAFRSIEKMTGLTIETNKKRK
jgi:hypothetical protein